MQINMNSYAENVLVTYQAVMKSVLSELTAFRDAFDGLLTFTAFLSQLPPLNAAVWIDQTNAKCGFL
jgi:hypothetical protein